MWRDNFTSVSVCFCFFLNICFSLICLKAVPSFLTRSINAKLTPASVTAVSAQYALEELRLGRAGISTQKNVDVSSHLVLPTWRRQRGSHTSNHLEKQSHSEGSERPTWVLGFSSKQSQRQSSFDVLVPVDRWRYAGKELQKKMHERKEVSQLLMHRIRIIDGAGCQMVTSSGQVRVTAHF